MEIGPIFRALIQKKVGVILLVTEIAVTLAVVLNCINLVIDNRKRLMIPSGLDEENIIVLSIQSYGDDFEEDEFSDQIRQRDLELIRAQPGVIDAAPISPLPLQGGGSSTQRKIVGAVNDTLVRTPVYRVDEHFLATLDLELHEGRAFTKADILPRPDPDAPPAPETGPTVPEVEASDVAGRLDSDGALFLLDVREPWEWLISSLEPRGACLIPLGELEGRMDEVPRDRSVVVYCRSGQRSLSAARRLAEAGFADVANLTGGMLAWARDVEPGLPVV